MDKAWLDLLQAGEHLGDDRVPQPWTLSRQSPPVPVKEGCIGLHTNFSIGYDVHRRFAAPYQVELC
jgi:hypothetical protein